MISNGVGHDIQEREEGKEVAEAWKFGSKWWIFHVLDFIIGTPPTLFFIRKELGDDSAINAPFNYIRLVLAAVELISTQPLYRPLIERNNILDWSYSDPSHDSSSSIIWPPSPEKRGFSIQRKRPQNSLVVYYLFMCLFLGLIFECVSV
jgi:hypothetical protein